MEMCKSESHDHWFDPIAQGRPLVLVVDDEPNNIRILVEALRADYEVAIAKDGRSALDFLEEGDRPNIILMDIMMPGMDGFELCRQVKKTPSLADIPIIFITALTDDQSEEKGFELGVVDYIHKPFNLSLVRARVRTHMTIQGMMDKLLIVNSELNQKLSELNKANQALHRKTQELKKARERQELFSRVFASTAEGIMVTDADGVIVAVNRSFTRITGFEETEALGATPKILKSNYHGKQFYEEMWERLLETGYWNGEIFNRRKNGEVYPELRTMSAIKDNKDRITHFVVVFSDVSSIKRSQEQINFLTWHDALTQLPNRFLLLDRLDLALKSCHRSKLCSAVLVLDLDGFKAINDANGLLTGDRVLVEVSRRLSALIEEDDTVARITADEFAILLSPVFSSEKETVQSALKLAEKINERIGQSIDIDGRSIRLSCSTGVMVFPGAETDTALQVFQNADTARHRAMMEGGGQVVFFLEEMGEEAKRKFELEQALRDAIKYDQLKLHLQSQVNHKGDIVGAEALIRWQHPEWGIVSPAQFIPIAEESKLIIGIDKWVLRQVCQILASLEQQGIPLRISVNISPKQFFEGNIEAEVERLLAKFSIQPSRLVLEVTENLMIENMEQVINKMHVISDLGVLFSIDDFGTGYSSLAYLKRLPIQELKIDKSFVLDAPTDQNDAALIELIQSITTHLGIETVAEGVEGPEHAQFMNRYPQIVQQGYYYGRPEYAPDWLEKYLESYRKRR